MGNQAIDFDYITAPGKDLFSTYSSIQQQSYQLQRRYVFCGSLCGWHCDSDAQRKPDPGSGSNQSNSHPNCWEYAAWLNSPETPIQLASGSIISLRLIPDYDTVNRRWGLFTD
ncbi:hypothetical protein NDI45_01620 [Leptolyngbya sp. GB1-A1]|uniref:hypothetical protein n=1 Tax=Leptolyngbya sp. GB1-A1 TaxID=2933908 RepID=UPI00329A1069